jgi:hypothetical protein
VLIQFNVYEGNDLAFVESIPRARKVPHKGTCVQFPDSEDTRFAEVTNIIWYMFRDADPLVQVIAEICDEPKCRASGKPFSNEDLT